MDCHLIFFVPSAVICLLLQKCVRVLAGCDDVATFSQKTPPQPNAGAAPSQVKGQVSPMTKLGIGLTVRYSILLIGVHVSGVSKITISVCVQTQTLVCFLLHVHVCVNSISIPHVPFQVR